MRGSLLLSCADIRRQLIMRALVCQRLKERIARLRFQLLIPVAEHLRPDIQRDACDQEKQIGTGKCAVSAQENHDHAECIDAEQEQARGAQLRCRQPAQHNRNQTEQDLECTCGHGIIKDAGTFGIALNRGKCACHKCRAENHCAEGDAAP